MKRFTDPADRQKIADVLNLSGTQELDKLQEWGKNNQETLITPSVVQRFQQRIEKPCKRKCHLKRSPRAEVSPVEQIKAEPLRHEVSYDIQIALEALPRKNWLTSVQRTKALEDLERVFSKPQSIREMGYVLGSNMRKNVNNLIWYGFVLYATSCAIKEAGEKETGEKNANGKEISRVGSSIASFGSILMMAATSDMLRLLKKTFACELEYPEAIQLLIEKVLAHSQEQIKFLPKSLRVQVEAFDRKIIAAVNANQIERAINLMRAKEIVFHGLPMHTHPIDLNDVNQHKKLDQVIQRTLPENHRALNAVVHAIADNSKLKEVHELADGSPAGGKKVALFLNGPRGTGKTEFVRLLAEASGKYLCEISLERLEHISELIGSGIYNYESK